MRLSMVLLRLLPLAVVPTLALAQEPAAASAPPQWRGRHVVLARVDGRAMAPACPEKEQIEHFVYVRTHRAKWDRVLLGCRFMLSGNFTGAQVVDEAGDYIAVRFTLVDHGWVQTFWTPRRNYLPRS